GPRPGRPAAAAGGGADLRRRLPRPTRPGRPDAGPPRPAGPLLPGSWTARRDGAALVGAAGMDLHPVGPGLGGLGGPDARPARRRRAPTIARHRAGGAETTGPPDQGCRSGRTVGTLLAGREAGGARVVPGLGRRQAAGSGGLHGGVALAPPCDPRRGVHTGPGARPDAVAAAAGGG